MSKEIGVIGGFLIVTDTVSGIIDSPQPIPSKEMTWNEEELQGGRVVFETTRFLSESTEFELYPPFALSESFNPDTGLAFTESEFRDFCTFNLGGSGESVPLPTYGIEVAAGNIPGSSTIQLVGRNPAVGTQFEDIWDAGVLSTLDYDAQTGNFTAGLLLTGGTSGATAIIATDKDDGATGVLTIRKITGTFQNNETITDSSTGSATSNGLINPIMAMIYPASGETLEVVCENINDTSAGTGARTLVVAYLDSSFIRQTEIITLNGHTPVTFVATNAYRFISASILSWGSASSDLYGKSNLGTIIIRDSATKNIRGVITYDDSIVGDEHGLNNTQDIHYTVPAGKTAFPMLVLTNVTKNHDVTARALIRPDGADGFSTLAAMGNYQNSFILDFSTAPAPVPEKTDLKFIARSNNTSVGVVVELFMIEIEN